MVKPLMKTKEATRAMIFLILIRVVSQEEGNIFVVFVELGVGDREVKLQVVNDRTQLELSYKVPRAPDQMFQVAGLHATSAVVEDILEFFYFNPSKKFSGKHEEIFYPNAEDPSWVIFKYLLEEPKEEEAVEMNICAKKVAAKKV